MQEATTSSNQIDYLYETKEIIAPGLAIVVKEIVQSGHNPENILKDIIKLARVLDLSAPAPRYSPSSINNPRYHLLDYLKRAAGSLAIRGINADDVLFDKNKPFTCISQVQEIFEDVYQKIALHFIREEEYA